MSIKLVFEKKEIFERVQVQSVYLSDPVGTKEGNTSIRIADVIPITSSEDDIFYTYMYEAGARVLELIGAYTEDIDFPYQVTDSTDPEFPESIIYEIELYSGAKIGKVIPILQMAVAEALIYYIVKEWLKIKGYAPGAAVYEDKCEKAFDSIRTALMYGQRVRKKYRIL